MTTIRRPGRRTTPAGRPPCRAASEGFHARSNARINACRPSGGAAGGPRLAADAASAHRRSQRAWQLRDASTVGTSNGTAAARRPSAHTSAAGCANQRACGGNSADFRAHFGAARGRRDCR